MFAVQESLCDGCGTCVDTCPRGAIDLIEGVAEIDSGDCVGCGACFQTCPQGAIYQLECTVGTPAVRRPSKDALNGWKSPGKFIPRPAISAGLALALLDAVVELARAFNRFYRSRRPLATPGRSPDIPFSSGSRHRHRRRGHGSSPG